MRSLALAGLVVLAAATPGPVSAAPPAGCPKPDATLPYWARARVMTVLNDSVLLSGERALRRGFPCWRVHLIGRPALMLDQAEREIRRAGRRVAPLVVVGVGYNSLWERGRGNHARWAAKFDLEASRLLRTLRRAGAEKVVWVTLRNASRRTTDPADWGELSWYSWYFPYVNERLRVIDARRNRVVLADWWRAGARRGLTYDSIHLNDRGGRAMQELIETTIYETAWASRPRRPDAP